MYMQAKKALRALRGLVKLQALARGHLVRKRMNIVLRSMQAVLAIQVRARIQRIQMAEEPPVMVGRRKSYRESSASDTQLRKEISVGTHCILLLEEKTTPKVFCAFIISQGF